MQFYGVFFLEKEKGHVWVLPFTRFKHSSQWPSKALPLAKDLTQTTHLQLHLKNTSNPTNLFDIFPEFPVHVDVDIDTKHLTSVLQQKTSRAKVTHPLYWNHFNISRRGLRSKVSHDVRFTSYSDKSSICGASNSFFFDVSWDIVQQLIDNLYDLAGFNPFWR